jgi:hypothetical protein
MTHRRITFLLVNNELTGAICETIDDEKYFRIDAITPDELRALIPPKRAKVTDLAAYRKKKELGLGS